MGRLPLFIEAAKETSDKYLDDFSTLGSVALETL
jgi:hypothetical protein